MAYDSPFQRNGAPRGYGQQSGSSIYLDNPRSHNQRYVEDEDERRRQAGAVQAQIEQPTDPDQQILNAQKALMQGAGATGNAPKPQQQPQQQPASPAQARPWQRGEIVGGAREGADFARLGGGFGAADTDSLKHTFGRLAQNFDRSDAGLQALVQDEEFRRLFPNATLSKDWIDFGGQYDPHSGTNVGKVDVAKAWTEGGGFDNYQWLTEEEALAGAQPAAQPSPMMNMDNANPLLMALMQGQGDEDGLGQLLQMLMSGQQVI